MQPQNTNPSSTPQYDFILNEQQQQKQGFVNRLKSLPKPVLILLALGLAFLLILLLIALRGGSSQPQPLISAVGRAQEISRVSGLAQAQSKDADTQALAATTQATLNSDQQQITSYLGRTGTKVDPKSLLAYQDKKTDQLLTQAASENKLEQAYRSYLKNSFISYKIDLQTASKSVGKNGKSIISGSLSSVQVILSEPQLSRL